MRNPAQRRTASAVIAVVGAITLALTIAINRGRSPVEGAWFGIVIASFFITLFAIVGVITFQVHVRWIARLKRGDRRLAQWMLAEAEWAQFRANDKVWLASGRSNTIKSQKKRDAGNIEVTVAEDALMIGDDFYHLGAMRGLQWIPETPPCLEYNMVTSGKSGTVKWNIRFPVAAGADAQARTVWDYVHRPIASNVTRSVRRFRFSRVAGLFVAAVSGLTLLLTRQSFLAQAGGYRLWFFIASLVGFPVGLFVSALCHAQLRTIARQSKAKRE